MYWAKPHRRYRIAENPYPHLFPVHVLRYGYVWAWGEITETAAPNYDRPSQRRAGRHTHARPRWPERALRLRRMLYE